MSLHYSLLSDEVTCSLWQTDITLVGGEAEHNRNADLIRLIAMTPDLSWQSFLRLPDDGEGDVIRLLHRFRGVHSHEYIRAGVEGLTHENLSGQCTCQKWLGFLHYILRFLA